MGSIKNFIETRTSKMLAEDGAVCAALILLNTTIIFQLHSHQAVSIENVLTGVACWLIGDFFIVAACIVISIVFSRVPTVKCIVHWLLIVPSTLIMIFNAFLMYKFGVAFAKERLDILVTTDPMTAFEFVLDYVLSPTVIIGLIVLVGVLVFVTRKLNVLIQRHIKPISTALFAFVIGCALSWVLMIISFAVLPFSDISGMLGRLVFFYLRPTNSISLVYTLDGINNSYKALGNDETVLAAMDAQDEQIISNASDIPFVVIIMGEATDRNHVHLYGYRLPTTPHLDARHADGELVRFDDTISCACYTLRALSMIFTFAETDGGGVGEWYTNPNVFDVLNRAGYHTAWLSNQSSMGFFGNIDRIYGARSSERKFIDADGAIDRQPDEVLLPVLDESLKNNAHDKNFYVVHLEGTHQKYDRRYPPAFNVFGADDEDKPTAYQRQLTAEYDNAILYNDHIVDEIIKRFEDKDAVIFYFADHGEVVFEGSDFAGHGDEHLHINTTIEIPMLVWTSKEFRAQHADKWKAIEAAAARPYETDWMIHSVLDLMSIETTSFEPGKSIFNDRFDGSRMRMFGDEPYVRSDGGQRG